MDFVRRWSEKTEIGAGRFIRWLNVAASKFYEWQERYGKVNEHNGWVSRDLWLEDWEKQAIIGFHLKNPLEGYRRLTFMMLDAEIVTVSPSSVWRVLSLAGLLSKWNGRPSKKGTGFEQPRAAHQHWLIDVSYINIYQPELRHNRSRVDWCTGGGMGDDTVFCDDPLRVYLTELRRVPAEANLQLVVSLAERHRNERIHILDLIEKGNEGLLRAVQSLTDCSPDSFAARATTINERALVDAATSGPTKT